MRKIIAIVTGLALSNVLFATTFYKVTIPDIFEKSELVVYGEIEAGRILLDDCGVEYAVRVQESFKGGSSAGQLIWFQNSDSTQIGGKYFLFLSKNGEEFTPLMSTNSGAMNLRARYVERCKNKWSRYKVNVFGNGALKSTSTYSEIVPRAVLIDDVVVIPPEGVKMTKFGPYDRYDNDRNHTALDADEFMTYMKVLSNSK